MVPEGARTDVVHTPEQTRREELPLVILAGADPRPTRLPGAARGLHPLAGYKALELEIAGRPLLEHLLERVLACGRFRPVHVAGPARLLDAWARDWAGRGRRGVEIVDVEGGIDVNVRTAVETVRSRCPGQRLAFLACDILPSAEELSRVMALHDRLSPADVFFPLVRYPDDPRRLGRSAWKPAYRLREGGGAPVRVLPGHLLVVDPEALRLRFIYRLLSLAYRARNRPLVTKMRVFLAGLLFDLLRRDFVALRSGGVPGWTWHVITSGLVVGLGLRSGRMTRERLERIAAGLLVRSRHRRRHPERGIRLPLVDILSLARDIDTVEEAAEAGARVQPRAPEGGPATTKGDLR